MKQRWIFQSRISKTSHQRPAPCSGSTGAPRAVAMLALAGAFADDEVAAREDLVEVRIVVHDRFERAADIAEQSGRSVPCRWRGPISGNRPARRSAKRSRMLPPSEVTPPLSKAFRYSTIDRLSLFVGHRLLGKRHRHPPSRPWRRVARRVPSYSRALRCVPSVGSGRGREIRESQNRSDRGAAGPIGPRRCRGDAIADAIEASDRACPDHRATWPSGRRSSGRPWCRDCRPSTAPRSKALIGRSGTWSDSAPTATAPPGR